MSLAILDGMFVNTTMVGRSETRKHFFFHARWENIYSAS